MNTIAHQRALSRARARISAGWCHQPAHYSFYRRSPANEAHIPFDDDIRRARRRRIAEALCGATLFVALLLWLAFAPVWARWLA